MEVPEDSAVLLTLEIDQRNLAASALVDLPASLEAPCPIAAKKSRQELPSQERSRGLAIRCEVAVRL
jgi:hypothetical protein